MLNNIDDYLYDSIKTKFWSIQKQFQEKWALICNLSDLSGNILDFGINTISKDDDLLKADRARTINESLRWGEPFISITKSEPSKLMFGVPVMINSLLLAGIVVEYSLDIESSKMSAQELRKATIDLLNLTEKENLTNTALLELHKSLAKRENTKAEAIHEIKDKNYKSIRDIYLLEEPSLISAIKRGDKPSAIEIINRILVEIYSMGSKRPSLLKSFLLELVVTMSRTAVEAGGDPTELLGTNYSSFAELAKIESEEDLCEWVVSMLEKMIDAINANKEYPSSVLLVEAVSYMQANLQYEISRDQAAEIACLSPSHFSRVIKQTFGETFTDLLAKFRIEKSKEYLLTTDKNLTQIAYDCGFNDQSYFTKVFQKYTSLTPGEYRRSKSLIHKR